MPEVRKKRYYLLRAVIALCLFAVLLIAVTHVDVREIGPDGAPVGLAAVNSAFRGIMTYGTEGVNTVLLKIRQYVRYALLILALIEFIWAVRKLSNGRRRENADLKALIFFLVLTMILCLVFTRFLMIVPKPVMTGGKLAPGFPSCFTLLAVCILSPAASEFSSNGKGRIFPAFFEMLVTLLLAALVILDLIAGVHWLTDVIGGLLLGRGIVLIWKHIASRSTGRKDCVCEEE